MVRRFWCDAAACGRKIFAERFSDDVLPTFARRTLRLAQIVHHLGLALGGRPGAGLAQRLMLHVTAALDLALAAAGLDQVQVVHRPRLLSDNGPSYVASDLADWLGSRGMTHIRGAPRHPQTQGKIERWHQTLKNRILLEHAYLPGELEARVAAFVEHDNHVRAHESLSNLTPADVYFGRGEAILQDRARIKRQTLMDRRLRHHAQAA